MASGSRKSPREKGVAPWSYYSMKDERPFFLAGLWSEVHDAATGEVADTYTVIITDANAAIRVHDRMRVILATDATRRWIEPGPDAGRAAGALLAARSSTGASPGVPTISASSPNGSIGTINEPFSLRRRQRAVRGRREISRCDAAKSSRIEPHAGRAEPNPSECAAAVTTRRFSPYLRSFLPRSVVLRRGQYPCGGTGGATKGRSAKRAGSRHGTQPGTAGGAEKAAAYATLGRARAASRQCQGQHEHRNQRASHAHHSC